MDTLTKLFSSASLVKIMRLFLFHSEEMYDSDAIIRITGVSKKSLTYETKLLTDVGFLKSRSFYKTETARKNKKEVLRRRRVKGWMLNEKFPYLAPLRMLLVSTDLMNESDIRKRLQKTGRLKLIATSGIFLQEPEGRLDLFIVGDAINKQALTAAIRALETVMGSELRYAAFTPREFEYRLSIGDRLVRDVFDYPHLLVLNRMRDLALTPGRASLVG